MSTLDPKNTQQQRFFAALLAITLLPLLLLPFLAQLSLPFNTVPLIGWAIFLGGVAHVASTAYFYGDPDAKPIMQPMPGRFLLVPLGVIALALVTVLLRDHITLPDSVFVSIFCFHLIWLHYHYQKQNYGLIAFAAASHKKRLPQGFLTLLMLPSLSGGLAIIPELLATVAKADTFLTPWQTQLKHLAVWVYIAASIAMLVFIRRHKAVFKQKRVAIFTLVCFSFYLPALLIEQMEYAFWAYALTHGFQYLLMLGFVAANAPKPIKQGVVFVLAAIAGGLILSRLHGSHAVLLCGVFLNWVHFVLDAKLWKMSDDAPRQYLRQRFAFIFNSNSSSSSPKNNSQNT